jgi:hypothetical protein
MSGSVAAPVAREGQRTVRPPGPPAAGPSPFAPGLRPFADLSHPLRMFAPAGGHKRALTGAALPMHPLATVSAVLSWSFVLAVAGLPAQEPGPAAPSPAERAFAALQEHPRDAYRQFVVLQLARRADQLPHYATRVARLANAWREQGVIDLFDLFTGALAVQESLQLDRLRAGTPAALPASTVPIATLTGPTVKSHPWQQLLAGRTPAASPLSLQVPADFWLAEFGSLQQLLLLADRGDLWGSHLVQQAARTAVALDFGERLRQQLAIETTPILRPFYDQVVERVALTGSDLYLREGTDLTVLFALRQPPLFRARMQSFLQAAQELPGARRETFELAGVAVEHVATPDRAVHVFAADPSPDLHVRSNSRPALARVLAAIQGKEARLGDSDELRYVRTLMPAGAPEEDGFVYLSDPFVRRIVGPQVKLAERRRLLCSTSLRLLGHGALLHATEHGKRAATVADLLAAQCLPPGFGDGTLGCPDGGKLTLAEDGLTGCCSVHGRLGALVPCLELPLTHVTADEESAYQQFVRAYGEYWRTFFDPIVVRVAVTPAGQRLETLVLPMIDNTVYTQLARWFGGEPAPLGDAPRSERSLLVLAGKVDKRGLLAGAGGPLGDLGDLFGDGVPAADVRRLLEHGLGERLTLQVLDQEPMFDFSLPGWLGAMLGNLGTDELTWTFLVQALNAPVLATIDVQDAAVVDTFLDQLDTVLARRSCRPADSGFFTIDLDSYHFGGGGPKVRCMRIGLGPLGWRVFWARIDRHVVVASRKNVLEELLRQQRPAAVPAAAAHALLVLRAQAWNAVRADYELGWAENARRACLDNLGPLSDLLPLVPPQQRADPAALGARLDALARTVHGARFYCPDGGDYLADSDRGCRCTVHGTALAPIQPAAPSPASEVGRLLRGFRGSTATLTFLPEGLRAAVEIEQK